MGKLSKFPQLLCYHRGNLYSLQREYTHTHALIFMLYPQDSNVSAFINSPASPRLKMSSWSFRNVTRFLYMRDDVTAARTAYWSERTSLPRLFTAVALSSVFCVLPGWCRSAFSRMRGANYYNSAQNQRVKRNRKKGRWCRAFGNEKVATRMTDKWRFSRWQFVLYNADVYLMNHQTAMKMINQNISDVPVLSG